MPSEILFCLNQKNIEIAYTFKLTKVKIYSFEEALFYCYYNWKQCFDDICSNDFGLWVKNVLSLENIYSKIKEINFINELNVRVIKFLSLTDYFSIHELATLQKEIKLWENILEWEKLKEQGDYFVKVNNFQKALNFYNKALFLEENNVILNNIGIAYNKLSNYSLGNNYLEKAYRLDENNVDIVFNYAESQILSNNFDSALKLINKIENKQDANYLLGLYNFRKNDFLEAINYFNSAYIISNDDFYIYKMIDVYLKNNQYNKSLEILEKIQNKNIDFFIKNAEICFLLRDIKKSIKIMINAVFVNPNNVLAWVNLAKYYRFDFDNQNAEAAITKALELEPNNTKALFEKANIKKAQGKIKEFQVVLNYILNTFKKNYRENYQV